MRIGTIHNLTPKGGGVEREAAVDLEKGGIYVLRVVEDFEYRNEVTERRFGREDAAMKALFKIYYDDRKDRDRKKRLS